MKRFTNVGDAFIMHQEKGDIMIFRKLEKVLLAIVFCIGMVFMAAPLSAFAATSVMVNSLDYGTEREVRYDIKPREVEITLVTDGIKDEYFMDGIYVVPVWMVSFTDGKNIYWMVAYMEHGSDQKIVMRSYIYNYNTREMSWCSSSISGNELTWTATLPENVFPDPIAVDTIEFMRWIISELNDPEAVNGLFKWSLDAQGNATLWDGQGTIPVCELSGYADQVKSIDVNVKSFPLDVYMFSGFSNLETATLKAESTTGEWLNGMFDGCQNLRKADLSGFRNANALSAMYLFNNCSSLTDVNLSGLNTKSICIMDYMFYNCSSLKSLDLSSFDTGNLLSASYMFSNCNSLESLDLSTFDMGKVIFADEFLPCEGALQTIRTPKNLTLDCKLPDGDGLWKNESTGNYVKYLPKNEASSQTLVFERWKSDSNLVISKKALVLFDTITIDFMVDKSIADKYHNLFLLTGQDGLTKTFDTYSVEGNYLVFRYRVPPYMMNEEITAVLCAENASGEKVLGEQLKYSVADYCYNMLNKEEYQSDTYKSFRRLLVDILNYGDAAQKYMDHKTDNLAGSRLTAAMASVGTQGSNMTYESVKKSDYETASNPLAEITNASLFLGAAVNVQFKFATNSLEGLTLVVTDGTKVLDVIKLDSATLDSDGRYFVRFNKLNAAQMRKTIYATVMKGDQKVSNTYRYSIESYVASVKGKSGQTLDDLLDSMMRYGDSAENYVISITK